MLSSKLVSSILLGFFISSFPLSSVANAMNSPSNLLQRKRTRGTEDLVDGITKKYEYVKRDLLEKVLSLSDEIKDNIESVIDMDDSDSIIKALFEDTCFVDIEKLLKIKTESGSSVFNLILSNKRPADIINYFLSLYRECRRKNKKELKERVDQFQELLVTDIKDGKSIFGKILKNDNAINIFEVMFNNEKTPEFAKLMLEADKYEKFVLYSILEHDDACNILKKLFNYKVVLENGSLFFGIIKTLLDTDVSTEEFFSAELSGDEIEIISKFFKDLNQNSKAFFSLKSGKKVSFDEILKEKFAVEIIEDLFFRPNNIEFIKLVFGFKNKDKIAYGDSLFKKVKMLFGAKTKDGKPPIKKIKKSKKSDNIISILIKEKYNACEKMKVLFDSRTGKDEYVLDKILLREDSDSIINALLRHGSAHVMMKILFDARTEKDDFIFDNVLKRKDAVSIIDQLYGCGLTNSESLEVLLEAKVGERLLLEKVLESKDAFGFIKFFLSPYGYICKTESWKKLFEAKSKEGTFIFDKILEYNNAANFIDTLLSAANPETMKILFSAKFKENYILDKILAEGDEARNIIWTLCKYKGGVAKLLFSDDDLTRFTLDVLFCKYNNPNISKDLIFELDNKEYKFGDNVLKNVELLLDGTNNFENFKSRVELLLEKYKKNILPVLRPNIVSIPLFD